MSNNLMQRAFSLVLNMATTMASVPLHVKTVLWQLLLCYSSSLLCFRAARYTEVDFIDKVTTTPHFLMFYAPWCGHCKRLQPLWDKFAEHYSSPETPVQVAKVDCTKDTPLCAREDIKAYPTLRIFNGGLKSTYRGKRNIDEFVKFVNEYLGIENPQDSVTETPTKGAIELHSHTFEKHIEKALHFVEFYAPWCPHCQKLAPIWDQLADEYRNNPGITIAKVDCTKDKMTCQEQGVNAYPMLFLFHQGMKIEEYSGDRTLPLLRDYVDTSITTYEFMRAEERKKDVPLSTEPEEESQETTEGYAVKLTKDTFELAVSTGKAFVNFYAPWCKYCRQLKPTWEALAKKLVDEGSMVKIAMVDCTEEADVCGDLQVTSYPTLIFFKSKYDRETFEGHRTIDQLYNFVKRHERDEL